MRINISNREEFKKQNLSKYIQLHDINLVSIDTKIEEINEQINMLVNM